MGRGGAALGLARERQKMRSPHVKQRFWMLTILWMLATPTTWAATIEGVTFPERHQIENTSLLLNNVGLLRYRLVFKAYVAALYLGEGVRADAVLTDVPKRLELHYFWAIAGADFGKAADKIVAENVSVETLRSLRSRIERLHSLYENVKPGDRYSLTYIPGRGTELALNGSAKGTIEGADFSAAYFAIWLGQKPLDRSLRDQLLRTVAQPERRQGALFGSGAIIRRIGWPQPLDFAERRVKRSSSVQ